MNKLFVLASCVSIVFLVGCASAHQNVRMPDQARRIEDPAKGRIYVFRPSSFGGAVKMNVADGGNPIGATGPKSYLCWEREPGDVIVSSASENTSRVAIPLRAGDVYYVLQSIRMGIWVARNELELVPEERAQKELKACKPAKVFTQ